MDEKRKPFENEIPKYKKKSKKNGHPRADHKHIYQSVVLHSWWNDVFKPEVKHECTQVCEVCSICGRIDTYITSHLFQTEDMDYDITGLEHWYVDDYFDKFAKRMN